MGISTGPKQKIFDAVERIQKADTLDEVRKAASLTLDQFGIERFLMFGVRDDADFTAKNIVLQSRWPMDFVASYISGQMQRVDPVLRRARIETGMFSWAIDTFERESDPAGYSVLERAADFGLKQGSVVPIHSGQFYRTAVGLSGHGRPITKRMSVLLELFVLFTMEHAFRISHRGLRTELTRREVEVLTWVAAGKSSQDVGAILGISHRTVDVHINSILNKLGAMNRTHAVAIGLRDRLIKP